MTRIPYDDDELLAALERHAYSRAATARDLGLKTDTLRRWIRESEYELPPDPKFVKPESEVYAPTEQEIRSLCLQIQAGWTERDRERRNCYRVGIYQFPQSNPVVHGDGFAVE
jgi:transposase-like protein